MYQPALQVDNISSESCCVKVSDLIQTQSYNQWKLMTGFFCSDKTDDTNSLLSWN